MNHSVRSLVLWLRCPSCGKGALFSGLMKLHPACKHCGHDLSMYEHADGPAYIVIVLVSTLVVTVSALVEVKVGWPLWLHAAVWLPMVPLLSIWWLHHARAWLIALEYQSKQKDSQ